MSDQNLPATVEEFPQDFSQSEKDLLKSFKESGMPGISSVSHEMEQKLLALYMEGNTYEHIANKTRQKKVYILALSHKYKWFDKKLGEVSALADSLSGKKDIFFLQNEQFTMSLSDSIREYCSAKIKQFADSKDPAVLESLDHKLVGLYFKCLENLPGNGAGKKTDEKNIPQTLVNVQGDLKVGDDSKSNSTDLGQVLKALADLNRAKDIK
jgi:hypothetical protein